MGSNTERSHEPIYKTYTKIEAKALRSTTLLSQNPISPVNRIKKNMFSSLSYIF